MLSFLVFCHFFSPLETDLYAGAGLELRILLSGMTSASSGITGAHYTCGLPGLLSLKKILCVCALCMEMCIICVHYALRPKEDAVPQKLELEMIVSHHVKSNQGLWKISQRSSPLSPPPAPCVFLYGVSAWYLFHVQCFPSLCQTWHVLTTFISALCVRVYTSMGVGPGSCYMVL